MGTINVSFRCVANHQKELEGSLVCYANTLYEGMEEINKAFDEKKDTVNTIVSRAAKNKKPPRTTREFIIKSIRKKLKQRDLPKKIYNADIIILFMWDEYQLAENGSL